MMMTSNIQTSQCKLVATAIEWSLSAAPVCYGDLNSRHPRRDRCGGAACPAGPNTLLRQMFSGIDPVISDAGRAIAELVPCADSGIAASHAASECVWCRVVTVRTAGTVAIERLKCEFRGLFGA
jgi:hypothetical protein